MNKKGFTLTELLMVVVILGILGGIALPRFFPQKEKAYVAEAVGMLSAIRQGEEAYRTEYGAYCMAAGTTGTACHATTPWTTLGLDDPNAVTNRAWNYKVDTDGASNTTYTITATRRDVYAAGANAGKVIVLNRNGTYTGSDHPNSPV